MSGEVTNDHCAVRRGASVAAPATVVACADGQGEERETGVVAADWEELQVAAADWEELQRFVSSSRRSSPRASISNARESSMREEDTIRATVVMSS
jgi:hypothetical protein